MCTLMRILYTFNHCASISIFHGIISRIISVLLTICAHLFLTVNMSYLPLSFNTLIIFLGGSNFEPKT